jgi:hypothetical protein
MYGEVICRVIDSSFAESCAESKGAEEKAFHGEERSYMLGRGLLEMLMTGDVSSRFVETKGVVEGSSFHLLVADQAAIIRRAAVTTTDAHSFCQHSQLSVFHFVFVDLSEPFPVKQLQAILFSQGTECLKGHHELWCVDGFL